MEPNRNIFSIIKTEEEKSKIILNNILIMLSNRIYIDSEENKQPLLDLDKIKNKINNIGDNIFTLTTNNKDNYAIKIIFQKISAIGKQSVISDFVNEYTDYKKIIVAQDFKNKISDYVNKQQIQIFKEASLLQNIIDYHDQPKFELLSPKEMEQFKTEYNATDYTTKKILRSDPIVKYYALKKGDIIRIIRPSPTSGEAIDYRIVM